VGESDETKLRRERDRLTQRLAEKDDELRRQRERVEAAERRGAAARGQVTKIKNRIGHGVCPCCNRTFENLHRHMASQHPTFTAEAAE
jgi:DNA repair exonuclease SbcCD ATPase subunit